MSQPNVERIIGRLVTDEAFRRSFARDPQATLEAAALGGLALTPCEMWALASLEPSDFESFAQSIDPRLQKVDLGGERS